jgi:hypothetical protein
MKKKRYFIHLFILLFTCSVSVAVLPSGIINTLGLFGEVKCSTITQGGGKEKVTVGHTFVNKQRVKGERIYNIWYELRVYILCLVWELYMLQLPKEDTIVTLKVRMDN